MTSINTISKIDLNTIIMSKLEHFILLSNLVETIYLYNNNYIRVNDKYDFYIGEIINYYIDKDLLIFGIQPIEFNTSDKSLTKIDKSHQKISIFTKPIVLANSTLENLLSNLNYNYLNNNIVKNILELEDLDFLLHGFNYKNIYKIYTLEVIEPKYYLNFPNVSNSIEAKQKINSISNIIKKYTKLTWDFISEDYIDLVIDNKILRDDIYIIDDGIYLYGKSITIDNFIFLKKYDTNLFNQTINILRLYKYRDNLLYTGNRYENTFLVDISQTLYVISEPIYDILNNKHIIYYSLHNPNINIHDYFSKTTYNNILIGKTNNNDYLCFEYANKLINSENVNETKMKMIISNSNDIVIKNIVDKFYIENTDILGIFLDNFKPSLSMLINYLANDSDDINIDLIINKLDTKFTFEYSKLLLDKFMYNYFTILVDKNIIDLSYFTINQYYDILISQLLNRINIDCSNTYNQIYNEYDYLDLYRFLFIFNYKITSLKISENGKYININNKYILHTKQTSNYLYYNVNITDQKMYIAILPYITSINTKINIQWIDIDSHKLVDYFYSRPYIKCKYLNLQDIYYNSISDINLIYRCYEAHIYKVDIDNSEDKILKPINYTTKLIDKDLPEKIVYNPPKYTEKYKKNDDNIPNLLKYKGKTYKKQMDFHYYPPKITFVSKTNNIIEYIPEVKIIPEDIICSALFLLNYYTNDGFSKLHDLLVGKAIEKPSDSKPYPNYGYMKYYNYQLNYSELFTMILCLNKFIWHTKEIYNSIIMKNICRPITNKIILYRGTTKLNLPLNIGSIINSSRRQFISFSSNFNTATNFTTKYILKLELDLESDIFLPIGDIKYSEDYLSSSHKENEFLLPINTSFIVVGQPFFTKIIMDYDDIEIELIIIPIKIHSQQTVNEFKVFNKKELLDVHYLDI